MRAAQATPSETRAPSLRRIEVVDRWEPKCDFSGRRPCAGVRVRAVPGVRSKQLPEVPRDRQTFVFPIDETFLKLLPYRHLWSLIHPQTALQLANFRGPRILFLWAARRLPKIRAPQA